MKELHPKKYLESIGVSITDAAKKVNVSRPYLTDVLNGKKSCGRKLADAFELFSNGSVSWVKMMSLMPRDQQGDKSTN